MAMDQHHRTLGVISFGLAIGVAWAISVFLLGVASAWTGWGVLVAQSLSTLYYGFSPTFVGAVAGAAWAFGHGFLSGLLVAWLYNAFLLKRRRHMG